MTLMIVQEMAQDVYTVIGKRLIRGSSVSRRLIDYTHN
jgi:hypothetical protein